MDITKQLVLIFWLPTQPIIKVILKVSWRIDKMALQVKKYLLPKPDMNCHLDMSLLYSDLHIDVTAYTCKNSNNKIKQLRKQNSIFLQNEKKNLN